MKKIQIKKNTRFLISILLGLSIMGTAIGLYRFYLGPTEVEESIRVFSYKQQGNIEHKVNYRDNEFVPETPEGHGVAYITDLTESISTTFNYNFIGQRESKIQGEYKVTATVTAYTGKEKFIVWDKSYELLKPTSFNTNSKDLVIKEKIVIPLSEYITLGGIIQEGTKFTPDDLELKIQYHIGLQAETDSGIIKEEAAPEIVIPLRGRVYTLNGNYTINKDDGLMKTHMVPIPMIKEKRLGLLIAMGILTILLICFLLLTKGEEDKLSLSEKEIQRILNKYQDRIVIYKGKPETPVSSQSFEVKDFEGLIKVADELVKPILYNEHQLGEHCFIVIDKDTYVYKIQPHIPIYKRIREEVLHV